MSEPNSQQEQGGGLSGALNKKMGPFPVWLYLVVVGLAVFLFIYLRRQNSPSSDSSTDTETTSAATTPPFINQVYTNTTPPEKSAPDQDDKKRATKTIQLKNSATFNTIAKRWHMTVDQLIRLNPDLANKYENTGKKIPRGTKFRVFVPANSDNVG